ncbi:MAG TPA: hypothetical protein ENN97_00905 [Phycisphaerales bacterium]|nr:hypothetical protein [Phycisphaerales bacterium]
MNRTLRTWLAIFFIAVIAVSAVSITRSIGRSWRLDITDQRIYTLSDGTKAILAGLRQPITVRLFYTKTAAMKAPDQIRFYNNYYEFVKALLEEYVAHSDGKLKLEVIDPRPYSDEEMQAIRHGLRRFQITQEESFFFGLVVQTEFGATRIIEFFSPDRQQFVEYDISYLIDTAVTRQKKRLGVLSALPVMGDTGYMAQMMRMQGQQPKQKWGLISQLEQKYEVVSVPTDTDRIDDVDLLLVIHPKDIGEQTRFAIDQFVLGGGRAILLVDPHCVIDMPDPMSRLEGTERSTASNVPELLAAWGLEMPDYTFAGDRELAVEGTTAPNRRPEKVLGILKLDRTRGCFNPDHVISANLNEVTMMFPGVLNVRTDSQTAADLEYTALMMTTERGNSWRVNTPYELLAPDYAEFLRRFRDGSEPVVMAYLVTGRFTSAFPDGIEVEADLDDDDDDDPDADGATMRRITGLTEAQEPGAVIVVADVDFISDIAAYQRTIFGLSTVGDNSAVVLNALEDLAGSAHLISIRSRGNFKRPFTRVDEIESRARDNTAEEEERIRAQIREFERQLNERIQSLEGENRGELINQAILEEKREIELKLLEAEKRLRDVKMQERQQIENLKVRMRNFCTLPGPILTLLIAIGIGVYRSIRRRYYISHASDA